MTEWQIGVTGALLGSSVYLLWTIRTVLEGILASLKTQTEHMSHLHSDNKERGEYLRGTVEEISYNLSDIKERVERTVPDIDTSQPP